MVSNRKPMEQNPKQVTVMVSGGFDPFHVGHLEYLKAAKKLGDKLLVVINSDEWLIRKKGKAFMSEDDRYALLAAYQFVDQVEILRSERDDVSEAIARFKPDIFAKGGDRTLESLPIQEVHACVKIGCKIVTNVGGEKIRSSSELLNNYNL